MDLTLSDLLNALQQVMLKVTDSSKGEVQHVAGDSDCLFDLFPQLEDKQQVFVIDEQSPFLQDFIIEARDIWEGGVDSKLKSGFWTEVTTSKGELHLEATAIRYNGHNTLLIACLADEFKERQKTLQSARELFLSNDRLIEQNEYLHSRLLSILKKPQPRDNLLPSLTRAIENTGFSVIITDSKLNTIIENSATDALFLKDIPAFEAELNEKPVDIIINLMESQLPEFERILLTESGWDGELCWMLPPSTLKWLKIALYPVKTELNEVTNWIIFTNDITNAKHLVQKNEQLAFQDMLTNLPNRYSFWKTLEQKIIDRQPFYALYLDINKFRSHNEYYGHDGGDKLLIDLSERISSVLEKPDYIARIGSDQFAIILPNLQNQHDCQIIIERIFECTNDPFVSNREENFNITLSIGAAHFPNDAVSAEELMKFVDLSAYVGKAKDRNSIQFYSQSISEASLHVIELQKELKYAVKNQEFELYLQPIVNVKQNSIQKAEALIRWNHPKKGLISPADFIPIAEKSDLINAIGYWVIKSACTIVRKLSDDGYHIKVSINLSASHVLEENLFSFISDCIEEYKISPELLELEITEGVLINDYAIVDKLLCQIRSLGMSVSIDDFGTGYSSLAYLKRLPIDVIKIDQSFVKEIVTDDNDKAIVRAIIAMAHNLNLSVTAEGVETDKQLEFLKDNICNSVQGYYYSRPVNFNRFLELLKNFQE